MPRRSSRTRVGRVPSDLRGRSAPESLADVVLDDPARLFEGRSDPGDDQYEDLIHTGLSDSRVPSRGDFPVRSSPWVVSRATYRSRFQPGRLVSTVVEPPQLLERAVACAKRTIRREVLFALRKRGKGSGAKRRKRSFLSHWRC